VKLQSYISIDHFATMRISANFMFRVFFEPSPEFIKDAFLDEPLLGAVEDFAELASDSVHYLALLAL
jgi:hypothetical protein